MTKNIEIKNTLTIPEGIGEKDNRGKKGKDHQGTCVKDPCTKPRGEGLRVGGGGKSGRGKWWQENEDNCT